MTKVENGKAAPMEELLLQALETEMGGVKVYEAAIRCAENKDLKEEWREYHEQTTHHVEVVRSLIGKLGLDAAKQTPGRLIVRQKGQALVAAMEQARKGGDLAAAQLVAAECVVDAETKDHLNWGLIGQLGKNTKGEAGAALREAHEEIEGEEDEHLYHTMGWARELWIEALGMPAVLPPPEEKQDVKTAIGAARAKNARGKMLPA